MQAAAAEDRRDQGLDTQPAIGHASIQAHCAPADRATGQQIAFNAVHRSRHQMRKLVKEFVRTFAGSFPVEEPIHEFGSYQVPGQEGFADLRPLFPGKTYVGSDIRKGPGVDLVLDLHQIDLPSSSVGTALILDTLEHVQDPITAMKEVHRVLKPAGAVLISSSMYFPIHDYPFDYWRFTPQSFRTLLNPFASSFVDYSGDASFPHTVVGVGFKSPVSQAETEKYRQAMKAGQPLRGGWKEFAMMVLPPFMALPVYRAYLKRRGT